nr:hypothetical protein [Rhizobiaceae bacterium]
IGIRFIPLLGWAVLAYDVYSTSTEVVEAYEKLSEQIETVRKAENFAELEAVSKEIAAVFNIFFMNGVLSKILGTRAKTKGPDGKPPSSGKPAPKKDPKHDKDDGPGRVREGDAQYTEISAKTAGNDSVPLKNRQVGKSEGKAVRPLDAQYNEEIRDGLQIRRAKYTDVKEGFPTMTASDYATFRTEPVPRTLKPGEKIYRIVGDGSDPNGSYWTTDPPPLTEAEWRANSAVKNDWNGDGGYVEYTVPEGVEIPVWDGVVRAQRSSDRKGVLPGGGNQLFLDGKLLPSGLPIKRTPWNR